MHIGQEIRRKLEERQQTVVWLAGELSCTRTNVYKIFDKSSIDTELLQRISVALDFNFFSLYSDVIRTKIAEKTLPG